MAEAEAEGRAAIAVLPPGSRSLHPSGPALRLDGFEGPLELLLRLIERQDLDITAVSLVAVAHQYLEAIRTPAGVDASALAEFVAIGARLIYLKSRALLPVPPAELDLLDEDDTGRELVDMLVEYRRYSAVADGLQERLELGLRHFTRMASPPRVEGPGLDGVTLDAMRTIMLKVLKRLPPPPRSLVPRMRMSLVQRVAFLRERLQAEGSLSFSSIMAACADRAEVIVSFLAVLDLLKAGECEARQDAAWEDIILTARSQAS